MRPYNFREDEKRTVSHILSPENAEVLRRFDEALLQLQLTTI